MADNTILNPGSGGHTIADEDIGGVHFPVSKIYTGNQGVNGGPVGLYNPLPVVLSPPGSQYPGYDAFNRLRVNVPNPLFESKQIYDAQPAVFDTAVTGTGSSTYNANQASSTLAVTAGGAGSVIRQSFRRLNYQPGLSQLAILTGVLGAGAANVTKRIGLYDGSNGVYFVLSGTTLGVGIRTSTSGAPVDTTITQANWNLDKLDGTGPSGITLDVTKGQIFVIDFQWLGIGRVRFGFDIGGAVVWCHQTNQANVGSLVYMSVPNLPIRYEIVSTAAVASSLVAICSTVVSEGGSPDVGNLFSVDNGSTAVTTGNNTSIYPLVGIRLGTGNKLSASIRPYATGVMTPAANVSARIGLIMNPTITGTAPTWTDVAGSGAQSAVNSGNNVITAGTGTLVVSDYLAGTRVTQNDPLNKLIELGVSIAGVPQELWLFAQTVPAQGATNFYGVINFREMT